MQSHQQPSPGFGLDAAREFTARATWTFAKTMPWAPHEYTVRQRCRAQGIEAEFEAFVVLIESDAGHWRPWGSHRWRSLNLDAHTYWLHWNRVDSVAERTIVNRRHRDQMGPEAAQLALEVDR